MIHSMSFGTFLSIAIGAGAVIKGAYIYSRIKEKQGTEERLERMEQTLDEIAAAGKDFKEGKLKT